MGIIACTTLKDKNEILSLIEKSINNKKSTLDKKIYNEYYKLKDNFKPQKKNDSNNNSKEKDKEKTFENFPIANKKNNFIPIKKRMNRFIKWYIMSHPNQNTNLKNKRNSNSEAKLNLNNMRELNLDALDDGLKKNLNFKSSDDKDFNSNNECTINKNQSNKNLRNNYAISPITCSDNINFSNATESKNNVKNSDSSYFNNTIRLKKAINPNDLSPILNDKKVQFILESDRLNENFSNQSSNISVNLNSRFNNIPSINHNENNANSKFYNKNKNGDFNEPSLISTKNNFRDNSNSKLSSTLTMPNMNNSNNNKLTLNSNNIVNYNLNNICNTNSITKLKAVKLDSSVKVINKTAETISIKNDQNQIEKEIEIKTHNEKNNYLNLDFISNHNNLNNTNNKITDLNSNKISGNINLNSYHDNSSSKSNNDNKSTTARFNNNSKSNTYRQKEDTNSNSNSNSQNEKNNIFNNFYNNSHSQDNDPNSISICQQLNIFDDSNIIESNLRLTYKLEKEKFLKRVAKGPPDSFRWISWLIACNLPFDRSKDFYSYLLSQQLNPDTDIEIKKDLNRTLSGFKISNNIMDDTQLMLYNILKAFSLVDKEVAYCQGMNFIVGFLLLISDFNEIETFYFMLSLFSNTFKDNIAIRGFFIEGFPMLNFYVEVFMKLFTKNIPELKKHFEKLEIPEEVWISKWFRTLFTLSLPINICLRIWDCLIAFGLDFLLNFALAFMKYLETDLLKKQDLFDVIEYFKKMSPFFALENEEDLSLIAESEKFMENFNIEEIISNAKKIKIPQIFIQEQFANYQKNHKIDLGKLKIKYDLSYENFEKKEDEGDFIKENINYEIKNSEYFSQTKHDLDQNNKEYYINTETCRSEIEKINGNLDAKKNKYSNVNKIHSILNLGKINAENNVQYLMTSETNWLNINSKNTNNNLNNSEDNNLSRDLENSQNNSDSDSNSNALKNKINTYTFKAKSNLNDNNTKLNLSGRK